MEKFDRAKFDALVAKYCEEKATRDAIRDLRRFAESYASKITGGLWPAPIRYTTC